MYRQRLEANRTFTSFRRLFEESFIMQLGGAFLALLFVAWPVSLLAGGVAILCHLARCARFVAIALLATSGAYRIIISSGSAHG